MVRRGGQRWASATPVPVIVSVLATLPQPDRSPKDCEQPIPNNPIQRVTHPIGWKWDAGTTVIIDRAAGW